MPEPEPTEYPLEEEDSNILPFVPRNLALSSNYNDSSKDWLKDLAVGTIFTCYSNNNTVFRYSELNEYEVLQHLDVSTRLKDLINDSYRWHITSVFSKLNTYVATIGVVND